MDSPGEQTLEQLLRHSDWLTALARRLVTDAATADDLVQDTWVAALRNPPDPERPPRPWLAAVLRCLAITRRRREAWRFDLPSEAVTPSAAQVAGRIEQERRLAREVLDLKSPYRDAILLRYYQGLSAARIARAMDVPAATVRSRIQRGLAQLRQRLDAEPGGRQDWIRALALLAGTRGYRAAGAVGVLWGSIFGKIAVVAGSLAVLSLLVWLASGPGGEERPPQAGMQPESRVASGTASVTDSPPAVSAGRSGSHSPRRLPAERAEGAGEVVVTRTAVRKSPDGRRYSSDDGKIIFWSGGGPSGTVPRTIVEAEVTSGSWTARFPRQGPVEVLNLTLAGKWLISPGESWARPEDIPRAILGVEYPRTRLEVVDATEGHPLDGVEILRESQRIEGSLGPWFGPGHPGPHLHEERRRLLSGARSPVEIVLGEQSPGFEPQRAGYWIKARDHAWTYAVFDCALGGDYIVELPLAGGLEVTVAGWPDTTAGFIGLFRDADQKGEPVVVGLTSEAKAKIDDLAVGRYWIGLGRSAGALSPVREGPIEVAPGVLRRVTVPYEPPAGDLHGPVSLEGVVVVQPGPLPESLQLTVESLPARPPREVWTGWTPLPLNQDLQVQGQRIPWHLTVPMPGEYVLEVSPLQVTRTLEVGPAGRSRIQIPLPELTTVRVELVEQDTGRPATLDSIGWQRLDEGDTRRVARNVGTARVDTSGIARFIAPIGRIEASCWFSEQYASAVRELTLVPGTNELSISLRGRCGIRLSLVRGEARMPWARQSFLDVQRVDGSPVILTFSRDLILLDREGKYSVNIMKLKGFEEIDEIVVDVPAETIVPVEVKLVEER